MAKALPVTGRRVLIVGAGDHGRIVAELLAAAGDEIAGFVEPDGSGMPAGTVIDGVSVIGDLRESTGWLGDTATATGFVVAIGRPEARRSAFERATELGLEPIAAVHPRTVVLQRAEIGPGAQICAGAIIGLAARIGPNAIVNTGASVDHDCDVGAHAFIAPGVRLAGRVVVGEGAWIGIGASVKEGVRIGAWSVVGAGAAVIGDVDPGARVGGVPARPLSDRQT